MAILGKAPSLPISDGDIKQSQNGRAALDPILFNLASQLRPRRDLPVLRRPIGEKVTEYSPDSPDRLEFYCFWSCDIGTAG